MPTSDGNTVRLTPAIRILLGVYAAALALTAVFSYFWPQRLWVGLLIFAGTGFVYAAQVALNIGGAADLLAAWQPRIGHKPGLFDSARNVRIFHAVALLFFAFIVVQAIRDASWPT